MSVLFMPSLHSNSMHVTPDFPKELIGNVQEFYVNNPQLSVRTIAEMSEKVFGRHISPDTLKDFVQRGGWQALRNSSAVSSEEISREVNDIRKIVYHQIVNNSSGGILIRGDVSYDEILERLDGLEVTLVYIENTDPGLVNAYMNLLAKSKLDLNLSSGSAKTPRQQVIEEARQVISEYAR